MSYTITTNSEPLPERNLVATLFGQPGVGKTSMAFTSNNPAMMDFDEGTDRAVIRKTTVRFENWIDALEFINSDDFIEHEFKTLIVDTAGSALDDYMTQHIITQDPKLRAASGGLTLQGYGALKNLFSIFLSTLRSKNVDLIMVAHATEKEDGEVMRMRPKMTGGAYDMLIAKSDLVGYVEMRGESITLDFNPTDRYIGKNCAQIPPIKVPHYETEQYQTFFADILDKTKSKMREETKEQGEAVIKVKEFNKMIESAKDVPELVDCGDEIEKLPTVYRVQVQKKFNEKYVKIWIDKNVSTVETIKEVNELVVHSSSLLKEYQSGAKNSIMEKAKELGFVFNSKDKVFELPKAEEKEKKEIKEASEGK